MTESATAPLRIPWYRAIWVTAMMSNVGSYFQVVAGAWLMKDLTDSSATWIAAMVVSNLLPVLFLSLFAGVVADMFSKPKVMFWSHIVMGFSAATMAVTTYLDVITPGMLLGLGLLLGAGMAFNVPAWESMIPELVPRGMVASAIALNSVSFNAARAIGPALGGLILALSGPALAFALNTLSYIGVIIVVALLARSWEPDTEEETSVGLIMTSLGISIRYARYAPVLRRVLTLVALFGITTAVIQAVLPNRTSQLGGSETAYGVLLGAMGVGALIAGLGRTRFESVRTGQALPYTIVVYGIAGIVIGASPNLAIAAAGMLVVGMCWILTLTTLNATTQLMTPGWIRGRVMSLYLLALTGILPIGSITSGIVADQIGAGQAMIWFSAATVILGLLAPSFKVPRLDQVRTPRFEFQHNRPSHWDDEGGPVLVTNTWQVPPKNMDALLYLLKRVRGTRLRNGAYAWRLYRDTQDPYKLTEIYLFSSWDEYLAQHTRISDAAAAQLEEAMELDARGRPRRRHLIAVDLHDPPDWEELVANLPTQQDATGEIIL